MGDDTAVSSTQKRSFSAAEKPPATLLVRLFLFFRRGVRRLFFGGIVLDVLVLDFFFGLSGWFGIDGSLRLF